MIDSAEGLFEVRGAVTADQQQAFCKIRHALGERGQGVRERLR